MPIKKEYERLYQYVEKDSLLRHKFLKAEVDKIFNNALDKTLPEELLWARTTLNETVGKENTLSNEKAVKILNDIVSYQNLVVNLNPKVENAIVNSAENSIATLYEKMLQQNLGVLRSTLESAKKAIDDLKLKQGDTITASYQSTNNKYILDQMYKEIEQSYKEKIEHLNNFDARILSLRDKTLTDKVAALSALNNELHAAEGIRQSVLQLEGRYKECIAELNAHAKTSPHVASNLPLSDRVQNLKQQAKSQTPTLEDLPLRTAVKRQTASSNTGKPILSNKLLDNHSINGKPNHDASESTHKKPHQGGG